MIISVIVAISDNYVIGENNRLLWHLPEDLKHFKKVTTGHTILMGRKTYESIGRPLPNRTNLVLSRQENIAIEGCTVLNDLAKAIRYAAENGETELFIIGGAEIYNISLPLAQRLYLTRVHAHMDGDAFFPKLDFDEWTVKESTVFLKDNDRHAFDFEIIELERLK